MILFLALLSATLLTGCVDNKERVALVPLGEVHEKFLQRVKASIEEFYHFEVDIVEPLALPAESYYSPRKRYSSSMITRWLKTMYIGKYDKVLGLTEADIYHARKGAPTGG